MPQGDYAFGAISPLLDENEISEELDLLTRLHDLHLVGRLVLAAQVRKAEMHPHDLLYAAIGTSLTPMKEASDETQVSWRRARLHVDLDPKNRRSVRCNPYLPPRPKLSDVASDDESDLL